MSKDSTPINIIDEEEGDDEEGWFDVIQYFTTEEEEKYLQELKGDGLIPPEDVLADDFDFELDDII